MSKQVIESFSPEDTFAFGVELGQKCKPGDILTLFSKGLGKGLAIDEPISSPTFTVVQVYDSGRLPFYHFDVYRIADLEEMDEIGYEDYFYGDGVCLIEWAEQIEELLPENVIAITIEKDLEKGFDYRRITLEETK